MRSPKEDMEIESKEEYFEGSLMKKPCTSLYKYSINSILEQRSLRILISFIKRSKEPYKKRNRNRRCRSSRNLQENARRSSIPIYNENVSVFYLVPNSPFSSKNKKKWRTDEVSLLYWAIHKISLQRGLAPSQLVQNYKI